MTLWFKSIDTFRFLFSFFLSEDQLAAIEGWVFFARNGLWRGVYEACYIRQMEALCMLPVWLSLVTGTHTPIKWRNLLLFSVPLYIIIIWVGIGKTQKRKIINSVHTWKKNVFVSFCSGYEFIELEKVPIKRESLFHQLKCTSHITRFIGISHI